MRNGTVAPLGALDDPQPVEVAATSSVIEIIIDGVVVRAGAAVSDEHLRRVIRAVRST